MAARLLVLQPDPSDPAGPLGEWLAGAGLSLHVVRPFAGDAVPADLRGSDGVLVLGGGMAANDESMAATRALLRSAVAAEVPTLGVCLGAQLLAVANGGRVEQNPDGPEIGASLVAKRAAAATDPLFGPLPITPDVIQWHFDAITALPPGAIQLASSPGCDLQAFRLGRLAWGIQFHIETTPDIVRAWAAEDAGALAGYDLDTILSRSDAVHPELAEVWQPFASAFAAIVADPSTVPAPRTIPPTTAAPITDPAAIRAALAAELSASRGTVLPTPGLRRPQD